MTHKPLILIIIYTSTSFFIANCDDDPGSSSPGDTDLADDSGVDLSVFDRGLDSGEDSEDDVGAVFTCDDEDGYSPNHTPERAESVDLSGSGGPVGLDAENLFVCPTFGDYYHFDLGAGDGVLARIEFAHRLGDLDLWLFRSDPIDLDSPLAFSASEADLEEIRYVAEEGGSFLLWVEGADEASGFYDLTIRPTCTTDTDCPCGPQSDCDPIQRCLLRSRVCDDYFESSCGLDAFEPNDRMSAPYPLFSGQEGFIDIDGAVCGDDVDYFRVRAESVVDMTIELAFDASNDLDLVVLDAEGGLVGYSINEGGLAERLVLPILAPGDYLIYVDTLAGGTADNDYDLAITLGRQDACEDDDDCANAAGRSLCIDGGCESYQTDEPGDMGDACDSDDDCSESAPYCLTNGPGFDDNFCSALCESSSECAALDGGQCLPMTRRYGLCYPACETDLDCPAPFSCTDSSAGTCAQVSCGIDADCAPDQACLRTDTQGAPYCYTYVESACAGVEADGNGRSSDATVITDDDMPLTGLSICDADDDWYTMDIASGPARLEVSVSYSSGADLDVYVYDALGNTMGVGADIEPSPEIAVAGLIPAGTYLIRVSQFPNSSGDTTTTYSLTTAQSAADACTPDGGECLALIPLRIVCDESGSCSTLDGAGQVPLGSLCDSSDDCVNAADFCFSFGGAEAGQNICTRRCGEGDDCADVSGTTCTSLGGSFAACLPE